MKHRKLFLGSIVSIPVGIILFFVGGVIAPFGIVGHPTGWWLFQTITYEATWVYYLGYGLSVVGIITIIGGISGVIMSSILEVMAGKEERPVAGIIFCSYCGTRNVKDAVYCKKCGKKIS